MILVSPSDVLSETANEGVLLAVPPADPRAPVQGDAAPPVSFTVQPMAAATAPPVQHDPEYLASGGSLGLNLKADNSPITSAEINSLHRRLEGDQESGTMSHSILKEAAAIVEGVRNQQHGHKERSFVAIAGLWTAYLRFRQDPNGPIRPHDVAQMMVLMKQQRAEWGTPVRDHFVDAAGYSGIAGELSLHKEG